MTGQFRSASSSEEVVNVLVSGSKLHAAWPAARPTSASGGVSRASFRMFARYPTPARRARSFLVGVLIAGLLGVFAVMSNSAAPATASGANYLGSVALEPLRRPVTGMA